VIVANLEPVRKPTPDEARQSIRMTADRLLVKHEDEDEKRSRGGLLIPATAQPDNRRCVWSEVIAVGPSVRAIEVGDHVLHLPDAGYEAEIRGGDFMLLRERDIHAVASDRVDGGTGLYL
jgi:chaperonin GroES